MAKLAGLMRKVAELERKLEGCTEAYRMLLEEYRQLKIKYSYQETMEEVEKVNEIRRKEGKNNYERIKKT